LLQFNFHHLFITASFHTMTTAEETMDLNNSSSSSSSSSDDEEDLFATAEVEDSDAHAPPAKRARIDKDKDNGNEKKVVDPALLEHAKKRLSKWCARLFDPDRPRGLVEAPQVIPLNDEFLSAFGKREKEFDEAMGRDQVEVETKIDDVESAVDPAGTKAKASTSSSSTSGTKVKLGNLAYRTSAAKLQQSCERFGPLREVKMILDKERKLPNGSNIHNSGLAFVTFELAESAQACVDGMTTLDGRQVRLSFAASKPKHAGSTKSQSALNRYWDKDISTVCFRCGGVGHMGASCTNPAKARPCPLCALINHDEKDCPCKRICFNCGVPGHVNRECPLPRSMPKRVICGICFEGGHHRLQCRNYRGAGLTQDATCMTCGKQGHFLCQDLKWFYGLQGMSCFNCGAQGHSGYDCARPNVYQCYQDPDLTNQEIERAEAQSV
jgi:cellular nucleic acid-binding protein